MLPSWLNVSNVLGALGAVYGVVSFLASVLPAGKAKSVLESVAFDITKLKSLL